MGNPNSVRVKCPCCGREFWASAGGEEQILLSLTADTPHEATVGTAQCPNIDCRARFRIPLFTKGHEKKDTEKKDTEKKNE